MNNKDALAVKRALYEQGTSLKAWADEHGYAYNTVLNAVNRHAGGHAGEPWGQKTRVILRELGKAVNLKLIA